MAEGCSGEAGTAEVTFSPVPPAATAVVPSPAVDAYERNARLGRGVNLGNALEAPQEGEWGVVLQEEYFDLIAEAGFDSVRIPIRWSAHAEPDAPYTIDPVFFMRVDWAVDQALSRGLLVVLNIHHYEEIMENPQGQRERFLALWEQIASHYQGYSLDLLFELLNEPMGELTEDLWNEMLGEALDVVRQTNPQRDIIVGPVNWNSLYALHGLELPEDRHIIVAFHSYDPFEFTHQGAEWVSGSEAWLGTTWEGSLAQERAITRAFDLAAVWAEAHDRPLTLGEFGAYSKADMESRALWTAFVARQAEARGMSWAYWEFCAGFGVYDASRRTWNEPILEALLLSRATLFERRLARLNGLDGRRKEALAGL
ncbi:MAG: glycoside hydrolase family 5 protein, partial [Anaerolineae bacterium]|nr:glycoside hydrolase family 5 protein [Anaerolineae bacterium]